MKYEDKLCKYPFGNKIIQQRILHDGCPYAKLYNKRIIQINNIRFLEQLSTHEDHVFVWTYLNFVKEIRLCSTLAYHYMRMNNNETLSTKYHSSEEYILASDNLLKQLSILQESLNLKNNQYLKEVYSDYGLSQLLRACKNADSANYIKVYNYVRSKKKIFDVHYISRKYSERIFTAILFYRLLPNKLLYCLVKLFATK